MKDQKETSGIEVQGEITDFPGSKVIVGLKVREGHGVNLGQEGQRGKWVRKVTGEMMVPKEFKETPVPEVNTELLVLKGKLEKRDPQDKAGRHLPMIRVCVHVHT